MTIEITEFRNAKYLVNDFIDCEINHPKLGWIPFTADRNDTGAQFDVAEFYDRIVESGDISPYVPPTQEELDAQAAMVARADRDYYLQTLVDPLVSNPLRWADLTQEKQNQWAAYRRALLDIPEQEGFPQNIVWPQQP